PLSVTNSLRTLLAVWRELPAEDRAPLAPLLEELLRRRLLMAGLGVPESVKNLEGVLDVALEFLEDLPEVHRLPFGSWVGNCFARTDIPQESLERLAGACKW